MWDVLEDARRRIVRWLKKRGWTDREAVAYESMGEDGTGLSGFNVHFVRFGLGFLGATAGS